MAKSDKGDAPRSILMPLLLTLLALVGLFNVLMGAYLYTAYQNQKAAAASAAETERS